MNWQNNQDITVERRYAAVAENKPVFISASTEDSSFKATVAKALRETLHQIKDANVFITDNYPKTFKV